MPEPAPGSEVQAKHPGGRPAGQAAYNRQSLLEYLKANGGSELSNARLAEELAPFTAGEGELPSVRSVSRWLKALVERGEVRVVEMHYRIRARGGSSHWKNVRKIQLAKPEEEGGTE